MQKKVVFAFGFALIASAISNDNEKAGELEDNSIAQGDLEVETLFVVDFYYSRLFGSDKEVENFFSKIINQINILFSNLPQPVKFKISGILRFRNRNSDREYLTTAFEDPDALFDNFLDNVNIILTSIPRTKQFDLRVFVSGRALSSPDGTLGVTIWDLCDEDVLVLIADPYKDLKRLLVILRHELGHVLGAPDYEEKSNLTLKNGATIDCLLDNTIMAGNVYHKINNCSKVMISKMIKKQGQCLRQKNVKEGPFFLKIKDNDFEDPEKDNLLKICQKRLNDVNAYYSTVLEKPCLFECFRMTAPFKTRAFRHKNGKVCGDGMVCYQGRCVEEEEYEEYE